MADRATVESVAEKLGAFTGTLPPEEQDVILSLLNSVATSAWRARMDEGRALLEEDPDFSLLDEINASISNGDESEVSNTRSSPLCVAATTTITTIASHPAIGCGGGGHDHGPGPAPQYSPYPACMGG